jgi:exodeoxyribonuclease-1
MAISFYFYDLETSGFNPREARIMQFAGQRTDEQLRPIHKPDNFLITLSEDVVPDPGAILITGITPQKTVHEGVSEFEFLQYFHTHIATPDTIFVGYNSIRFDDEFMRYLHYRNFYDPYEWQWRDGRSRWDLLDLARMTRALRPQGITWPFDANGKPSNRLELLTSVNKLDHSKAHDALSDVVASIAFARLIKTKQPKLFSFLLNMRDKKSIAKLVLSEQPFVYTSGKYESEYEKTTIALAITKHPERDGALVYDLRYDPEPFVNLSVSELVETWRHRRDEPGLVLPVKTILFNRCPAVAPLSVLDEQSAARLQLDMRSVQKNAAKLAKFNIAPAILEALHVLNKEQQASFFADELEVDQQLYEGFFNEADKTKMSLVRAADSEELSTLDVVFKDQRLSALLPLYKARNFPNTLSAEERSVWEQFKERKLLGGKQSSRLAKYFSRLSELYADPRTSDQDRYLLEELTLWGEAIMPSELA